MAITVKDFLDRFPEFNGQGVNMTLINAKFQEAAREIDQATWGTFADDGQAYLTAHLLATTPMGQSAKLVAKDGTTTYGKRYHHLVRVVALGGLAT